MESNSNKDVKSQGNEATAKPQELMFTTRAKQGITTYQIESRSPLSFKPVEKLSSETATLFEYTKDGSLLWFSNAAQFQILETATQTVLKQVEYPNIQAVSFSPSGKFFVTWEKPTAEKPGDNLTVWSTSTAEPVLKLNQKQYSNDTWPTIRFADDDSVAYRLLNNEVVFYNTASNFSENKLRIEHLSGVSLSPGPFSSLKVAIFIPEKRNTPASARIYKYGNFSEPVASKNFFKAQEAQLLWNSTGTVLLIVSHTDVDKSGKNYYGETGLYYMQADGKVTQNVVLKKEGPIHDCKWAPNGKEFLVIYGFMPAQATLFNLKCEPLIDFGDAPRNTIRWNSSSRLVCLGGFGNLSGQMDIWDRKKVKKLGSGTADYTSSIEWSPDNRFILIGVLFHRMRIGNQFSIWSGDGRLVHKQQVNELYQVQWKPMSEAAVKELVLATPKPPKSEGKESTGATTTTTTAAAPAPAKTGVYRPPHMSGYSLKREETGPVKYNRGSPAAPVKVVKDLPPGYDAEDDKKPNNKKKKPQQQQQQAPPAKAPVATFEEPGGGADAQKKIKTISRQLATIDKLKNQKESGQTLTAEQEKLVASEDKLRAEMEKLSDL